MATDASNTGIFGTQIVIESFDGSSFRESQSQAQMFN